METTWGLLGLTEYTFENAFTEFEQAVLTFFAAPPLPFC